MLFFCLDSLVQLCEIHLGCCMWKDLVLFLCCVVSHDMNIPYVSQSAVGEHLFPVFIEWDNILWGDISILFLGCLTPPHVFWPSLISSLRTRCFSLSISVARCAALTWSPTLNRARFLPAKGAVLLAQPGVSQPCLLGTSQTKSSGYCDLEGLRCVVLPG